ncbi:hypothetical protein TRAPUB_3678 [Trametes pubescens]|uniref:Uncharacterized protein n=1 Tax=Trametes pubescens TaxID=154538 RepID=A0A1M2VCZ0_TRAPU|nr:hypothetical protein TRAPUB_3678 [Trametes pubescens]
MSQTIAVSWSDIDGIVDKLLNDAVDGDFKTGVHTVQYINPSVKLSVSLSDCGSSAEERVYDTTDRVAITNRLRVYVVCVAYVDMSEWVLDWVQEYAAECSLSEISSGSLG